MTPPAVQKKEEKPKLEDICTPIFDPPMGRRMRWMRVQIRLRQEELAQALGVSQSIISEMETGKCSIPRNPFTVTRLKEVFGVRAGYILYGTNPERFFPSPTAMSNLRAIEKADAEWDSKSVKTGGKKNG